MMARFRPLISAVLRLASLAVVPCAHGAVSQGAEVEWTATSEPVIERTAASNGLLDVSALGLGEVDFMTDPRVFSVEILDQEAPRWPDEPPLAGESSDLPANPATSTKGGSEGSGFTIAKLLGALGVAFLLHPGFRRR